MKRNIFFLVFILFLIPLLSACNNSSNSTIVKTMKIKKFVDTKTQGVELREKEITKAYDIEQILSKLKSFKYKDIEQEVIYGFRLIIEYTDDKKYTYVFCGDRVNINGKYYGITSDENESMNKLYDSLDYKENPSISPSAFDSPKVTDKESGNFSYGDELTFYNSDEKTNKNPTAISVVTKYFEAMKKNDYNVWISTMTTERQKGFLANEKHELGVLELDILDVHYEVDTIYKHHILEGVTAKKNGWTADNIAIVYALFDAKYDHTKVPNDDGKTEWHFFLIRMDKNSPWYIQDWGQGA